MTARKPLNSTGRSARFARERAARNLRALMEEGVLEYEVGGIVPDAWRTLEEDLDCREPQDRITLRMDRSVIQFYKAMGRGYQRRISRILATWAQLKIAGVIDALEEKKPVDPHHVEIYRRILKQAGRD